MADWKGAAGVSEDHGIDGRARGPSMSGAVQIILVLTLVEWIEWSGCDFICVIGPGPPCQPV